MKTMDAYYSHFSKSAVDIEIIFTLDLNEISQCKVLS